MPERASALLDACSPGLLTAFGLAFAACGEARTSATPPIDASVPTTC